MCVTYDDEYVNETCRLGISVHVTTFQVSLFDACSLRRSNVVARERLKSYRGKVIEAPVICC